MLTDEEKIQLCLDVIQMMLNKGVEMANIMSLLSLSGGMAAEMATSESRQDYEKELSDAQMGAMHNYKEYKKQLGIVDITSPPINRNIH